MNLLLKKLLIVALATPVFAFAQTPTDKVLATVAGEPVTVQNVIERANVNLTLLKRAGKIPNKTQLQQIQDSSFSELIEERVLLNQARKIGISTSEADINKAVNELAQAQNLTSDALKASIVKQAGGQGLLAFNRDVNNELTINALKKQEVADKIQITPSEVDAFLIDKKLGANNPLPKNEILEALHIFVAKTTPASKKKIDVAKQRITAGESFEAVGAISEAGVPVNAPIALVSSDTAAAPEVRALINSLADGAVSDVIKTKNGFHLFKAIAHKTDEFTLDKQKQFAKDELTVQKFEAAYKVWYENLMNDAKKNLVEIKP